MFRSKKVLKRGVELIKILRKLREIEDYPLDFPLDYEKVNKGEHLVGVKNLEYAAIRGGLIDSYSDYSCIKEIIEKSRPWNELDETDFSNLREERRKSFRKRLDDSDKIKLKYKNGFQRFMNYDLAACYNAIERFEDRVKFYD